MSPGTPALVLDTNLRVDPFITDAMVARYVELEPPINAGIPEFQEIINEIDRAYDARVPAQCLARIASHHRIVSATRSAASCCTKCPAPGTVTSVRSFSSQFHVPDNPSAFSAVSLRPWNISTGILTFGSSGAGGVSAPAPRG